MKEELIQALLIEVIPTVVKRLEKPIHGIVHKREQVEINGVTGFLVWDYIVWNEITFETMDGKYYSFFNSVSDQETEEKWNELVGKFGI